MTNFPVLNVINLKMQQRSGKYKNKNQNKYQCMFVAKKQKKKINKKIASKRCSIIIIYFRMRRINGNKLNIYAT